MEETPVYQTTRRGEGEAHPSPTRSVASTLPGQSRYRKALLMAYEEKCNYFGGGKSDMITVVVPGDRMKRLPQESIPERKRRQRERQQRDVIKQDRWWDKAPAKAGERCSTSQANLSNASSFTGAQGKRFRNEGYNAISGDFCQEPRQAISMLQARSFQELNIPMRSADFRTEVEWRMHLRSQRSGRPGGGGNLRQRLNGS